MNTLAYKRGVAVALLKLGFIEAIDPEDLPSFLRERKKVQLQRYYKLNTSTGFPAGGLIESPYNAVQK